MSSLDYRLKQDNSNKFKPLENPATHLHFDNNSSIQTFCKRDSDHKAFGYIVRSLYNDVPKVPRALHLLGTFVHRQQESSSEYTCPPNPAPRTLLLHTDIWIQFRIYSHHHQTESHRNDSVALLSSIFCQCVPRTKLCLCFVVFPESNKKKGEQLQLQSQKR